MLNFNFYTMRVALFLMLFVLQAVSCQSDSDLPGYMFSNFKDTPVWELAQAVNDNDGEKIKELSEKKKLDLNFEDPEYNMTLLCLSIVNNKKEAFVALIKNGADIDKICGLNGKTTPLLEAIKYSDDCEVFYVKTLIENKCKVNYKLKYTDSNGTQRESIPLFESVFNTSDNGDSCVEISKLLINNGANVNDCYYNPPFQLCQTLIHKCLLDKNMDLLAYLIFEKKIEVPNTIKTNDDIDGIFKESKLSDELSTEEYDFIYAPKAKKTKEEIVDYLRSKGK
jgi:hypothetical protein